MNRDAITKRFDAKAVEAVDNLRTSLTCAREALDRLLSDEDLEHESITGYLLDAVGYMGEVRAWWSAPAIIEELDGAPAPRLECELPFPCGACAACLASKP